MRTHQHCGGFYVVNAMIGCSPTEMSERSADKSPEFSRASMPQSTRKVRSEEMLEIREASRLLCGCRKQKKETQVCRRNSGLLLVWS